MCQGQPIEPPASSRENVNKAEVDPIPKPEIVAQHCTSNALANPIDFHSRNADATERCECLLVPFDSELGVKEWLENQVPDINSADNRKLGIFNPVAERIGLLRRYEKRFPSKRPYLWWVGGGIDVSYSRNFDPSLWVNRCGMKPILRDENTFGIKGGFHRFASQAFKQSFAFGDQLFNNANPPSP